MTPDIEALRQALSEHVSFGVGRVFSYDADEWHAAASPDRIARLLDARAAIIAPQRSGLIRVFYAAVLNVSGHRASRGVIDTAFDRIRH